MRRTQPSAGNTTVIKKSKLQRRGGLTRTERVVGPPELLTRGKVLALDGDTLEVIRVVLEAIRDIRCALGYRRWCVPMFGLVRLGEPGYDGMGQGAGAGRSRTRAYRQNQRSGERIYWRRKKGGLKE